MTKIELGPVGAVLSPASEGLAVAAAELEELGFSTIWLTGGPLEGLGRIADVVRATSRVRVGTGIISVDRFPAADVAALYADLESSHPGRFVVGLGGAHGPRPLRTLATYLDALDSVPVPARVLAALGPRMLEFARHNAAGALPVLVTPGYTAEARGLLGDDTTLAVEQLVVLDDDPARARDIASGPLRFLGTLPAYQANFRRMGFSDEEITKLADRFVDELITWGPPATAAARVAEHTRAGADHVVVGVTTESPSIPLAQWRALAEALFS